MSYYEPDKHPYDNEETRVAKMADNVAPWSRLSKLSVEEQKKTAATLGPNWASVMSGIGDQ